jgi:hypothetical protein
MAFFNEGNDSLSFMKTCEFLHLTETLLAFQQLFFMVLSGLYDRASLFRCYLNEENI